MSEHNIFAALPGGGRIWAVAAIHGEAGRLAALHARLEERLAGDDRLIYLGNYFGLGDQVRATVDELLTFRRRMMARHGWEGEAIVFLRGCQEEMWQKLLQLQFAPNPIQVLQWMLDRGVGQTLAAYGGDAKAGFSAAREGILALTRWTGALRQNMRALDGHTALMSVLKHAAYTEDGTRLFVHAGVDPSRPLSAQSDSFWWGAPGFSAMTEPYDGFRLVVRGFDPRRGGIVIREVSATIDGGCGFGGPLVAACVGPDGKVQELVEA